jgi:NitT/TauT family transport system ATP-binding protein
VVLRRASTSEIDPVERVESHEGDARAGAVLSVRGLGKYYALGRGEPKVAVQDVGFEVRRGEFVCVVGPSGAGKTTLLRCLAGLTSPSRGEVLLDGTAIRGASERVGVVFQDYSRSLFPWMSVAGNVALPLKVRGVAKAARRQVVEEVLDLVGLAGVEERYPWQLSGGMQQRVAIARSLAYRPELLFMDEPYASVDAQARAELEDVIADIHHRLGVTVFFVTHDIDEAVYLSRRVIVLSGRPTRVRAELEVPLPYPRDQLRTRALPTFVELRTQILAMIQAERRGGVQLTAEPELRAEDAVDA